ERDIISVAPPLFVTFVVWLHRGAPRPQPGTSIVAWLAAVPIILLPVRELVTPSALPDAFMSVPLLLLRDHSSTRVLELTWSLLVAFMILIVLFSPRRVLVWLGAAMVISLFATSLLTQHVVERRVAANRTMFFGHDARNWVDRITTQSSIYLYDDDPVWNV